MRSFPVLALVLASCSQAAPAQVESPRVTVELATPTATASSAFKDSAPARVATRPHDDTVDVSGLTPRELDEYDESIVTLLAPCQDTPVSIGMCLAEKRHCASCAPAARFLAREVVSGKTKQEREEAFHARFDADRIKSIALDDSPVKGLADAPVTIVVWADFECPMCATFEPMLEEVQKRAPSKIRVVFKHYPISHHAHAAAAARAAIAAANQGKFWEMAQKLFENQTALEQGDLEKYAKQIGLDPRKLKADMQSRRAIEVVARDMKQADDLGLEGTPFVFIDGRPVELGVMGADPVESMIGWVNVDLELAGLDPISHQGGAARGAAIH